MYAIRLADKRIEKNTYGVYETKGIVKAGHQNDGKNGLCMGLYMVYGKISVEYIAVGMV